MQERILFSTKSQLPQGPLSPESLARFRSLLSLSFLASDLGERVGVRGLGGVRRFPLTLTLSPKNSDRVLCQFQHLMVRILGGEGTHSCNHPRLHSFESAVGLIHQQYRVDEDSEPDPGTFRIKLVVLGTSQRTGSEGKTTTSRLLLIHYFRS